jgi:hypothetical protein
MNRVTRVNAKHAVKAALIRCVHSNWTSQPLVQPSSLLGSWKQGNVISQNYNQSQLKPLVAVIV